jgi:hypothetical protein
MIDQVHALKSQAIRAGGLGYPPLPLTRPANGRPREPLITSVSTVPATEKTKKRALARPAGASVPTACPMPPLAPTPEPTPRADDQDAPEPSSHYQQYRPPALNARPQRLQFLAGCRGRRSAPPPPGLDRAREFERDVFGDRASELAAWGSHPIGRF